MMQHPEERVLETKKAGEPELEPSMGESGAKVGVSNKIPMAAPVSHRSTTERLLDAVEKVRAVLDKESIDVPGVAVIGGQSSGKSSVLSALTKVDLPRGTGTVTRCPIVVHCERSDEIKALVSLDSEFSNAKVVHDMDDLAAAIAGMQPTSGAIENRPVHVKVARPDIHRLVLIDLPGIKQFSNHGSGKEHALTVDLVKEYIRNPSMVILVVMSAEMDVETCEAIRLAREHDPAGKRTLGVLTKTDCLPESDPVQKINLCKRLESRGAPQAELALGYLAVRTRTETEAMNKRTHQEVLAEERKLFTSDAIFSRLEEHHWGIDKLGKKVSELQANMVRDFMQKINPKLSDKIESTERELDLLGQPLDAGNERRIILDRFFSDAMEVFRLCTYERRQHPDAVEAIGGDTDLANLGGFFDTVANDMRKELEVALFDPSRGGGNRFAVDNDFRADLLARWEASGDGVARNHGRIFEELLEQYGVIPLLERLKEFIGRTLDVFHRCVEITLGRNNRFPDLTACATQRTHEHFTAQKKSLRATITSLLDAEIGYASYGDFESAQEATPLRDALSTLSSDDKGHLLAVVKATLDGPSVPRALEMIMETLPLVHAAVTSEDSKIKLSDRQEAVCKDVGARIHYLVVAYCAQVPRLVWTQTVKETMAFLTRLRQDQDLEQYLREDEDVVHQRAQLRASLHHLQTSLDTLRQATTSSTLAA